MEATQYGHKRMMKVGIFCEMEGGEKEMEGERMLACMYIQQGDLLIDCHPIFC